MDTISKEEFIEAVLKGIIPHLSTYDATHLLQQVESLYGRKTIEEAILFLQMTYTGRV